MGRLRELLFKPRWQHRSAEIRERAVQNDDDPRLLEVLGDIAREDPAAAVRLAALRRLHDILPLMRAAADDPEPEVRQLAFRSYRAMLAGERDDAPALPQRLEIVPRLEDAELLEYLARNGREESIRAAAAAVITRPGLLGDLVISEPSRALRLQLLERIDQQATLERVADALRTSDKRTYRAALDRLRSLGSGSEASADEEALKLCESLEMLARSGDPKAEKAERMGQLVGRWEGLAAEAQEQHGKRFAGARDIVERLLAPPPEPGKSPEHRALVSELAGALADAAALNEDSTLASAHGVRERLEALRAPAAEDAEANPAEELGAAIERVAAIEETIIARQPVDSRLTRLCNDLEKLKGNRVSAERLATLAERWGETWPQRDRTIHDDAVAERFRKRLERLQSTVAARAEKREQALAEIDGRMDALEAALAAGVLADAVRAKQRVLDGLALIGADPKVDDVAFSGRVASARGQLRELRDWQHWANNKIREKLCGDAEGLVGSGMHPDALAERIKELRRQWKELDDGERLPGDRPGRLPAPQLFKRFQTACNEAYTPARGFFEKRAEFREHHREELEALALQLEATAEDGSVKEPRELEKLVRAGRRSLRELANIPPRHRAAMARRLREGAQRLDDRLDELYGVVEQRKERLIAEIEGLDPEADLDGAISSAKDAQVRWKAAGQTRRNRDQALWKRFRAACDRIFEHASQKTAAARETEQKKLGELDALLEEATGIVDLAASDPAGAAGAMRKLRDRWGAIGVSHRGRERRFEELRQEADRVVAEQQQRVRQARREERLALVALCQQAEARWSGETVDLETLRGEAPEDLDALPAALRKRWQQALGEAPADLEEQIMAARRDADELCIAVEFLAGVESPEAARQARMDYQVARLSARMGGEAPPLPREEAAALTERWYALGPLPGKEAAACRDRFEGALRAIEATV